MCYGKTATRSPAHASVVEAVVDWLLLGVGTGGSASCTLASPGVIPLSCFEPDRLRAYSRVEVLQILYHLFCFFFLRKEFPFVIYAGSLLSTKSFPL